MELDAFDFGGELLAQLLVLPLVRRGELAAGLERVHARALDLGEFLEDRGDLGEFLERLGLQRLFHLGEGERVVLIVVLGGLRLRTPLDHVLVVFVDVGFGLVGDLFLFLDRGAGDLLADFAFAAAFAAFLGLVELLGGRAL